MPDLTLYEDDIELIRDAISCREIELSKALAAGLVHSSAKQEIEALSELRDKLLDRLVQRLHPKRDAELQAEQAALKSKVDFVLNKGTTSP